MTRSLLMSLTISVISLSLFHTPLNAQSVNTDPAIIEAAKEEGVVVWYSSLPIKAIEKMAEKFTNAYGIEVEPNRKGTYGLLQALHQEIQAGRVRADLFHVSDLGAFQELKDQGALEKYKIAEANHFPARFIDADGYFYPMRAYVGMIMWNSDEIPDDITIKSWKDLLNPKLKGLLVTNDASVGGGALYMYYDWKTELGEEWVKELGNQDMMVSSGFGSVTNLIVSGERPIGPMLSYRYWAYASEGQDKIKGVFPEEGVPMIVAPIGIPKGASHPNAARLFMDFLLSSEIQAFMQEETGQYSLRDDVPAIDHIPAIKDLNIWTTNEKIQFVGQNQRELQDEFANYFKE